METFLWLSPEPETVAEAERSESPTPTAAAKAAKEERGMGMGARDSSDGDQERWRGPDAASTCALWCTVAMGALVQGQPPERVRRCSHVLCFCLSVCSAVGPLEH